MSRTFTRCLNCAYWMPHSVDKDGYPKKSAIGLANGQCCLKLPPYLMRHEPSYRNTHENQGCDLGKYGSAWPNPEQLK